MDTIPTVCHNTYMKQNRVQKPKAPRSHIAVAAHFATGGGTHGGAKRASSRRDRQNFKHDLRKGEYA